MNTFEMIRLVRAEHTARLPRTDPHERDGWWASTTYLPGIPPDRRLS